MNELTIVDNIDIQDKIFTIRGVQVILDRDLAALYQVETKVFNQAVKRNIERFPEKFRFQLTKEELQNLRSQNVTFKENLITKYLPYAFTEFGVSMLSAVLKSDIAIEISIKIIESFVNMRKVMSSNTLMYQRLERIENRLSVHDEKFEKIFKAIEDKSIKPKQGIFYDGQIFDAYLFVSDLIKSAKKSIFLIDNYIDATILTLFSKNQKIEIKKFDQSHDRFLIIDEKEVYHIGASLKDLGKKWFAFSKMDINSFEIIGKLK
ncbi:ORF6N domain-containing protein [Sulfurimonas sediminis]|uniref:ORF6N domain-containing protein n=1 Tax=Sulfurimonas sediminis TaxID=2590020 RepID=A0A7M1B0F0_9BACT|nr:ORF6N domain-containing protein [Sulfurimonas sediminis]QOP43229.1 ORF6N domain-containing protein [Sulfurimonas sediminis]